MSYYDANYEEKEQDVFYLNEKKFKEAKHKFLNEWEMMMIPVKNILNSINDFIFCRNSIYKYMQI